MAGCRAAEAGLYRTEGDLNHTAASAMLSMSNLNLTLDATGPKPCRMRCWRPIRSNNKIGLALKQYD